MARYYEERISNPGMVRIAHEALQKATRLLAESGCSEAASRSRAAAKCAERALRSVKHARHLG